MTMRAIFETTLIIILLNSAALAQWNPLCTPCGRPVYQSQVVAPRQYTYLPQQVVTYQPVTQTQIRRQPVQVNVPVTTHRQVTVDEGSYQTVWVPKVVTKTVAETRLQPQVGYVDVPYQVVQHVPQVSTQYVAQYLPSHTYPVQSYAFAPNGPVTISNGIRPVPTDVQSVSTTQQPTPVQTFRSGQTQTAQPAPSNPSQTAMNPNEDWVKVPQKKPVTAETKSDVELQSYETTRAVNPSGMFARPGTTLSALQAGRFAR